MLSNLVILNTRPEPNNRELCNKLTKLGAIVISQPLIRLIPIDSNQWQYNLTLLEKHDSIILTSPFAAEIFLEFIDKNKINITKIKFISIGKSTTEKIKKYAPHASIITPTQPNSESICNMEYWLNNQKHYVLYPTGFGKSRKVIPNFLKKMGHDLQIIKIYKRKSCKLISNILNDNNHKINIILITSETSLLALIKHYKTLKMHLSPNCQLLVFSERLKNLAAKFNLPSATFTEPDKLINTLAIISQGFCNERSKSNKN